MLIHLELKSCTVLKKGYGSLWFEFKDKDFKKMYFFSIDMNLKMKDMLHLGYYFHCKN